MPLTPSAMIYFVAFFECFVLLLFQPSSDNFTMLRVLVFLLVQNLPTSQLMWGKTRVSIGPRYLCSFPFGYDSESSPGL